MQLKEVIILNDIIGSGKQRTKKCRFTKEWFHYPFMGSTCPRVRYDWGNFPLNYLICLRLEHWLRFFWSLFIPVLYWSTEASVAEWDLPFCPVRFWINPHENSAVSYLARILANTEYRLWECGFVCLFRIDSIDSLLRYLFRCGDYERNQVKWTFIQFISCLSTNPIVRRTTLTHISHCPDSFDSCTQLSKWEMRRWPSTFFGLARHGISDW